VHPGRRVTWYGDDTQRSRAIAILAALLGSWGRKGGYLLPEPMELPAFPYMPYEKNGARKADKPKPSDYPLADSTLASGVCDATIPGSSVYDVKGWFVYGTNLVQTLPRPENTYRALQELEFIVAVDVLPSEICGWAPAYKEPFLAVRQEVVPPMYESKPGWWIAREIALRIGLEGYFPWKDSIEYAMARLKAGGYDCGVMREKGVVLGGRKPVTLEDGAPAEFWTASGKIELYSNEMAQYGFDPMPDFSPPEEPPPGYGLLPAAGRPRAGSYLRQDHQQPPSVRGHRRERGLGRRRGRQGFRSVNRRPGVSHKPGRGGGRPGPCTFRSVNRQPGVSHQPGRGGGGPGSRASDGEDPPGLRLHGPRLRSHCKGVDLREGPRRERFKASFPRQG